MCSIFFFAKFELWAFRSEVSNLKFGDPQGSHIGLILFILFATADAEVV